MTDQTDTTTIFTVYSRRDDGSFGDWSKVTEYFTLAPAQVTERKIVAEGKQSKVTQTERQPTN